MKFKSDTYGEYELTKICKFTFFPATDNTVSEQENDKDLSKLIQWMDKFHPRRYFSTMSLVSTKKHLPRNAPIGQDSQHRHPFYLYVPLIDDNKDWYLNNKDCKFLKNSPKSHKFPIGITQKSVDNWLFHAKKAGILIKTY